MPWTGASGVELPDWDVELPARTLGSDVTTEPGTAFNGVKVGSDDAATTAAAGAGLAPTWLPLRCADAPTIAKAPSRTPALAAAALRRSDWFRWARLLSPCLSVICFLLRRERARPDGMGIRRPGLPVAFTSSHARKAV